MLFSTSNQPIFILIIATCAIFTGVLFDLKNIIKLFFNIKNIILIYFFDIFSAFLLFFNYYFINLIFNYGEIRLFSIIIYFIFFAIERYLSCKFVAKRLARCYNKRNERAKQKKSRLVEKI